MKEESSSEDETLATAPVKKQTRVASGRSRSSSAWTHDPSTLTLGWLVVSIPLVLWDTGYLLARPHSMAGGKWHRFWAPYAHYGTIDHIYGFPAVHKGDGFPAAQGLLNLVETAAYMVYLYIAYTYGVREPGKQGVGAPLGFLGRRRIEGRAASVAVLVGFTGFVMTASKTLLYGKIFQHGDCERHVNLTETSVCEPFERVDWDRGERRR